MEPVSTLYIGFKNQTHGSVYELPEFAGYTILYIYYLFIYLPY